MPELPRLYSFKCVTDCRPRAVQGSEAFDADHGLKFLSRFRIAHSEFLKFVQRIKRSLKEFPR